MNKAAIPILNGVFCEYVENCSQIAIFNIKDNHIVFIDRPEGLETNQIPKWLVNIGITDFIFYKCNKKIFDNVIQLKLNVFVGIKPGNLEEIFQDYVNGRLVSDENIINEIL
ncbi:MAG: hypothetical protein Kow0068_20490 [Marinilabiliales bacterium]